MNEDVLALAVGRAAEGTLSVLELIRAAEAAARALGPAAAARLYEAWVTANAEDPLLYAVLFNQSVMLSDAGALEEARAALERSLDLNPDFMTSYINLGRVLERLGRPGDAVLQWSALADRLGLVSGTAITHKTMALNQIARVLEENQQDAAAEAMLRQSLDLDREQREAMQHYLALRQRQCEWPVVEPWERVGREALVAGMSPLSMAAYADDPALCLAAAWNYNRRDVPAPGDGRVASHWAALERGEARPLRIGYLSSDLRDHAVGYLTAEVFELHDRGAVELFAYYCGPDLGGPHQERIKAAVEHWVPITGLDDDAAARRIADDGIQILVDLNGYTRDGRTGVVARRPAPVIVNWLGFPGTMGSPYHHYIIADDWIIPPGEEIHYSETVLRLPCYQPNDRRRIVAPETPSRAEAGLPDDAMVYCCFNGLHKLTRFTVERWLTVLERVPGSVLWLLEGAPVAHERLRALAAARGVAPERLVFAPKKANPEHLARYPLADLFLDTLPYGAHTTASDALWMGVPMLTLSGRAFAARVCGSLLRSAGLPDLVCTTPDEYIGRAVALGRDRARTRHYRDRLREGRDTCQLFDMPDLVRRLEGLFGRMWDDHRTGRLPRPDLGNLDVYLEVGTAHDHDAAEGLSIADDRGWWREGLARRHAHRPIPADRRLWPDGERWDAEG